MRLDTASVSMFSTSELGLGLRFISKDIECCSGTNICSYFCSQNRPGAGKSIYVVDCKLVQQREYRLCCYHDVFAVVLGLQSKCT